MPSTDFAIRQLLEEIVATLETLPSARFVPYWKMRARAFQRLLGSFAEMPPTAEQREGLREAVTALRSEIARSSGQVASPQHARPARNAS